MINIGDMVEATGDFESMYSRGSVGSGFGVASIAKGTRGRVEEVWPDRYFVRFDDGEGNVLAYLDEVRKVSVLTRLAEASDGVQG